MTVTLRDYQARVEQFYQEMLAAAETAAKHGRNSLVETCHEAAIRAKVGLQILADAPKNGQLKAMCMVGDLMGWNMGGGPSMPPSPEDLARIERTARGEK